MFDFELWSKKVYDLVEMNDKDLKEPTQKQLEALWHEMTQQADNPYVSFLNHLLWTTKGVVEGKVLQSELNQIVDEMRDKVLSEQL
ncbi:hypothetical protein [Ammoniphilus sp. 3BR4]|uniref:hypothetical protein n=1 Tax=Ammoniphilus sp. 3BR4 TaxID=3158265 RepID=UPI0034671231